MTWADERPDVEHVDLLIVGAGISGIGVAYYLQRDTPRRSFAILEARGAIGGTWDLFRYPGVRSDSDLYTFGYEFKPWQGDSIATGESIRDYLQEVTAETGIDQAIRYHHRVVAASWSSASACWLVDVARTDSGEQIQVTCSWLLSAAGYYRYDEGYTPAFAGRDRFEAAGGVVVHPQHWPAEMDWAGKRIVVVGSGATAVTLVPALAPTATHVTMLQRSPSYLISRPSRDRVAKVLQTVLPAETAHTLIRRKNAAVQTRSWRWSRRHPRAARRLLRFLLARQLPSGYPVDEHFSPQYDPWDQRMCAVPDGDLFKAMSAGKASVVTGQFQAFTDTGVLLESGEHLDADVIVTATGLNLQLIGGIALSVDGKPVNLSDTVAYRGLMLCDVPNLVFVFGYFFSSWTLKIQLLGGWLTWLLQYMDEHGHASCTPRAPGAEVALRPMLDLQAGYVRRAAGGLPKQGSTAPWRTAGAYVDDVAVVSGGSVDDQNLRFATGGI